MLNARFIQSFVLALMVVVGLQVPALANHEPGHHAAPPATHHEGGGHKPAGHDAHKPAAPEHHETTGHGGEHHPPAHK
jgi:hypothetical protein